MNEKSENFWRDALSGIDARFTDSAAEALMREQSGADGHAREIKAPPKKAFRFPAAAGIAAAAAAAVMITVGVRFVGRNNPPVSGSAVINTDFSQYTGDHVLFEKYFAGVWKSTSVTDGSPYLVLNEASSLGSIYDEVLFLETDDGCAMAVSAGGARELYLRSGGRLYRYDYTGGELLEDSYAEVYDYIEPAGEAYSYGAEGFSELAARHEGLSEFLREAELTADGELWTRAGTETANVRVYSEDGGELTLSAQFTNEAGDARYFCLDLEASGGSWEIAGIHDYDMTADEHLLYDPERDQNNHCDWDVFESVFAGVWVSDSGTETELSYSLTDLMWERIDSVGKTDGGWMITGFSGGCGEFLYISENDPDTLYYSELWSNEQTWGEYDDRLRRSQILPEYRGGETCLVYGIQGMTYKRSLAGYNALREYLSGLEGFTEVMDAAYTDFTDENGTEWSSEIPGGYALIGYPGKHYFPITLSKQRVEIGVPYIVKGSYVEGGDYDSFLGNSLNITDFVLVFENTDGTWRHISTRRDQRCDFLQQETDAREVVLESGGAKLSYKVYSEREGYVEISCPVFEAGSYKERLWIGEGVIEGRYALEGAPQLEVFPLDGMSAAAITYRENGERQVKFYAFNDFRMNELGGGLYTAHISEDGTITADPQTCTLSFTNADGQQERFVVEYDETDCIFDLRSAIEKAP